MCFKTYFETIPSKLLFVILHRIMGLVPRTRAYIIYFKRAHNNAHYY